MKTLFTLLIPVAVTIIGIASFRFFMSGDYYTSAVLTAIAYVSTSIWISMLGNKQALVKS